MLDEEGNFIEMEKNDAFQGYTADGLNDAIHFIQEEPVKGFMSNAFLKIKNYVTSIKKYLNKLFKRKEEPIVDLENNITVNKCSDFDEYINPNNYPRNNIGKYDTEGRKIKREDKEKDYINLS